MRRRRAEIFAKQFLETAQHIISQTIEPSEEGKGGAEKKSKREVTQFGTQS